MYAFGKTTVILAPLHFILDQARSYLVSCLLMPRDLDSIIGLF